MKKETKRRGYCQCAIAVCHFEPGMFTRRMARKHEGGGFGQVFDVRASCSMEECKGVRGVSFRGTEVYVDRRRKKRRF